MTVEMRDGYADFLAHKLVLVPSIGRDVASDDLHPSLFPFQRDLTLWALRRGRAAIWADTGLGKTRMQVEWARLIGERVLIVAPLSVARQTVREAAKIGVDVRYVRSQSDVTGDHMIWITNYDMIEHFDAAEFGAVVLDESSILKSLTGATRNLMIEMFADTPYRLCCTATPAPNDYVELGNHAAFLGICSLQEMLSMFFVNANKQQTTIIDGRTIETKGSNAGGTEWRLKHHAEDAFFRWLASWAITLSKPSDLGYDDDGFDLPPLTVTPTFVEAEYKPDDQLFFTGLKGLANRADIRRQTVNLRLAALQGIVDGSTGQWVVWCGLDAEQRAVERLLGDACVSVYGSLSADEKERRLELWLAGGAQFLVSKPRVAGFGLNLQQSHQMVFMGINDSWETYYQCIRREWRYGQTEPVDVHLILSDVEGEIYRNVMRKDALAGRLRQKLVAAVRDYEKDELGMTTHLEQTYEESEYHGEGWRLMLGDSCERLKEIETASVDLSCYSPPFADLFTYSASDRDLGNSKGWPEFFDHYAFIIREVLRVTKPGRLTCVHTSDIPAMQSRDGWIGIKDFPGEVINAYEREGWTFVGRAFVQKNPQAQAIRVKSKALLFVQLRKDSADSRPALVDQILLFKAPGDNAVPVRPVANGEMDNETWIEWANGIWLGISESDTLSYNAAREASDEKHICPLQLGTIERCIKLYSNPGETVLSPFAGIGSEGYEALRLGRRYIGIELKPSYAAVAARNLADAERQATMPTLWDATEG